METLFDKFKNGPILGIVNNIPVIAAGQNLCGTKCPMVSERVGNFYIFVGHMYNNLVQITENMWDIMSHGLKLLGTFGKFMCQMSEGPPLEKSLYKSTYSGLRLERHLIMRIVAYYENNADDRIFAYQNNAKCDAYSELNTAKFRLKRAYFEPKIFILLRFLRNLSVFPIFCDIFDEI